MADRERIGQVELQRTVASKAGGTDATCVKKDANAAHWLCAVTTTGAPGRCFLDRRPGAAGEFAPARPWWCAAEHGDEFGQSERSLQGSPTGDHGRPHRWPHALK